jgi:uncharacterized protein YkwD
MRFILRIRPLHAPRQLRWTLALGFLASICSLPFAVSQRANSSLDSTTIAEQYLLSAANQERAARGLSVLHRDPLLARAAAGHAREMSAHGSISHQFQGEAELTNRGASAGVQFSVISENVAEAPSVVKIHDMWMHSEHHRANLLDPSIDSAGISVISRGGELYAVEDFVRTVKSFSLEEQESAIATLVSQPGRISMSSDAEAISEARRTCAMSTGYSGARNPGFVMRFTADSLTQLPDQLRTRMASGRYRQGVVGACSGTTQSAFTSYSFAVLLYP